MPKQPPKHSTANKRTPAQKDADSIIIEDKSLEGWSAREIAQHLATLRTYRISDTQVRADLKQIRARWLAEANETIDDYIQRELKGLDKQERELWKAWRKSEKDAESETRESILVGKTGRKVPGTKVTKTREGQSGAVAFQNALLEIRRQRRELLGLDKPKKVASTTPDGEDSAPMIIAVSPDELPKAKKS